MAELDKLYDELRVFLTENNIPIVHSAANFDALINTFFGREVDNVFATDLMLKHFDTYRTEDGSIDPQAAVDINNYLTNIGVPEHANFDAAVSTDSGPIVPQDETAEGDAPSTVGGQPIPDIPDAQRTPDTIGEREIPAGMRLIRITDPFGSDEGELFVLVGDVYGVNLAYEVGDREALNAAFGGIGNFDSLESMTQAQFDASDTLSVGTIDELGAESLQAQFDRDMRAMGLENPPIWLAEDNKAMAVFITSINEGWSSERMYDALSSTSAFQTRFDGLDVVMSQQGTTSLVAGIAEFTTREAAIRSSILSARGPNADTSQEYVTGLIASGWQPAEVGELLALEKRVKANPGAMDNINEILTFQGLPELSPDDFISFLQDQDALTLDPGFTPGELFEGVNDALRFQALLTEGLDIDLAFAEDLGTGVSDEIGSEEQFSRQAQLAASFVASNARELSFEKMGLERDDIIAAMFGEVREGGRPVSEVNAILEQFAKERTKAAQGFTRVQGFIDRLGRPITQGFSDFQ